MSNEARGTYYGGRTETFRASPKQILLYRLANVRRYRLARRFIRDRHLVLALRKQIKIEETKAHLRGPRALADFRGDRLQYLDLHSAYPASMMIDGGY